MKIGVLEYCVRNRKPNTPFFRFHFTSTPILQPTFPFQNLSDEVTKGTSSVLS